MEVTGMDEDGSDAEIVDLSDSIRAEEAISARRRRFELGRQAGEDGSLAGVLTDLAEDGSTIVVATAAGRDLRGRISGIGEDHIALEAERGATILVALEAIGSIAVEPGRSTSLGDRSGRARRDLHSTLVELAAERAAVAVRTLAGDMVPGRLVSVGHDLVTIRSDAGASVYLPRAGIVEVTLL